jgi:fibronectin-binding autotransporter adhesin
MSTSMQSFCRRFARLVGFGLALAAASLQADTISVWNTGTGNWFLNSNWQPQAVPNDLAGGGPYLVFITNASGVVTLDTDPTITSLTLGGGGTLTGVDAHTLSVLGAVNLAGGTIAGAAKVLAGGPLHWTAGTMSGAAATELQSSSALTVSGGSPKTLARTLSLPSGVAGNLSGANVTLASGGVLSVGAGATFNLTDGAGFLGGSGGGSVNVAGTLAKSAGAASAFGSGAALNNSGLVQIQSVRLDLAGGTSSGEFQTSTGTELRFANGTHTVTAGATFTGPGLFTINSGAGLTANGDVTLPNLYIGGTLTANASVTVLNPDIAGTVNGTGNLLANGASSQWRPAAIMSGAGTTTVPGGATLTKDTANPSTLNQRALDLTGTLIMSGSGNNGINLENGGAIRVLPGGLLNLGNNAGFSSGTSGSIQNQGTFRKSGGTSVSLFNGAAHFTNAGLVEVLAGQLHLAGGASSGAFSNAPGTALAFNGNYAINPGTTFTGAGAYDINGTLTANAGFTLPNLRVYGTLTGPSNVTVTGANAVWGQSGVMSGSGQTLIGPGATMTKDTANHGTLNQRTVEVGGALTLSGANANGINLQNGGAIRVLPGGLLNLANDAGFGSGTSGAIHNEGTFRKSGGAGVSLVGAQVNTTNTGRIEVLSGQLHLGSGASSGAFSNAPGTTLGFNGNYALNAGTTFAGAGNYAVNGTLTANADFTVPNLRVYGTLTGPSNATVTGASAVWGQSGIMSGPGKTVIAPGATMTKDTANIGFLNQRTVEVGGTLVFSGSGNNGINLENGGTIHVLPGGLCNLVVATSLGSGTSGRIYNAGTIRKSAGAGVAQINGSVATTNAGLIEVLMGTLAFNAGLTQTDGETRLNGGSLSGTTLTLQGGMLRGAGNISASVNNSGGTIAPGLSAGALDISGALSCGAGSVLDFELGGTTPGTQYDTITCGATTLGGQLRVKFINGFEAAASATNTFTLLDSSAPTLAGAFFNVASGARLTTTDGLGSFLVTYSADKVILSDFQPGAPTLHVTSATPGFATIWWTPPTPGFTLQSTDGLSPTNWVNSPSGSTNPITVPATVTMRFYRLFKP